MATLTVRIPDELHDRIKQAATEDKRSANAEIEWLLDGMLTMRAMHKTLNFGPEADPVSTGIDAVRLMERTARHRGQPVDPRDNIPASPEGGDR